MRREVRNKGSSSCDFSSILRIENLKEASSEGFTSWTRTCYSQGPVPLALLANLLLQGLPRKISSSFQSLGTGIFYLKLHPMLGSHHFFLRVAPTYHPKAKRLQHEAHNIHARPRNFLKEASEFFPNVLGGRGPLDFPMTLSRLTTK